MHLQSVRIVDELLLDWHNDGSRLRANDSGRGLDDVARPANTGLSMASRKCSFIVFILYRSSAFILVHGVLVELARVSLCAIIT